MRTVGTFEDTTYASVPAAGDKYGVDIVLEFHPDKTKVDAEKIGLTQSVRSQLAGHSALIHPTQDERTVESGEGEGNRIDRVTSHGNPLYPAGRPGATDDLGDTATVAAWGQHGWHYFDGTGAEKTQEAILEDTPTLPGRGNNAAQIFETAALAVEGTQAGSYMGSVTWGWETDAKGNFTRLPLTLASNDVPSKGFMAAAEAWNDAHTIGTIETRADPTNVFDASYAVAFTVATGTEVDVSMGGLVHNDETYRLVRISDGPKAGSTGRIKMGDLEDQGDGGETIDLPIQWVGTIQVPPQEGSLATLRAGRGTSTATLADLPAGTRVKVMDDSRAWVHVEVDTTQAGMVLDGRSRRSRDAAQMVRGYVSRELIARS